MKVDGVRLRRETGLTQRREERRRWGAATPRDGGWETGDTYSPQRRKGRRECGRIERQVTLGYTNDGNKPLWLF